MDHLFLFVLILNNQTILFKSVDVGWIGSFWKSLVNFSSNWLKSKIKSIKIQLTFKDIHIFQNIQFRKNAFFIWIKNKVNSSIIWNPITSEMVIMKKSPKLHFYLFNKFFKKVLIKICNIMYFLHPYGTHTHTHTL